MFEIKVCLTKDSNDFKDASEAVKHIFTSNLLRQTALDSLQGRAPSQVFTPVVSLPELEALIYNWSFFETNIHSRSYSHIIRNIYNVPKDVFNTIHDTKEIVEMASSVGNYYDELHKYINDKLREQIETIHNLDIVKGITALTASPDRIFQKKEGFWNYLKDCKTLTKGIAEAIAEATFIQAQQSTGYGGFWMDAVRNTKKKTEEDGSRRGTNQSWMKRRGIFSRLIF